MGFRLEAGARGSGNLQYTTPELLVDICSDLASHVTQSLTPELETRDTKHIRHVTPDQ